MASVPPAGQFPPLDERALLARARDLLSPELKALSADETDLFWRRVTAQAGTLRGTLRALYPEHDQDALMIAALRVAATVLAQRPAALIQLDHQRAAQPDWFQRSEMMGYVAYAEQFGGDINGVRKRVGYLQDLGITYFHLMSVIRPREGANDGGFAVADYRDVDPVLGTIDDLRDLASELRAAGISLCIDFVMNHTAAEHQWALRAKAGESQYLDYFITYPDRTMPDRWEQSLPEVFPELAPGNFTWEPTINRWVWTTFNQYQWDLNYANPDVLLEMASVMGFLANAGVEILRLDAVAFTWKRLGTACQNQPEAHLIAQALRAITAIGAPATICKAEAIVGPTDLVPYLGAHHLDGVRVDRRECEVAYHNQLMVMLWSSVAARNVNLITQAHMRMPTPPSFTAWCTYVRCHDDIGWAVDDHDAAMVGIDGASHRKFLASFYRGDFPMSFARGVSFSVNEETGDERTCGSAAGLCGIDEGRMRADEVAIDLGIRRLLMMYGVVMGYGGIPLLYMGDELGLANDHTYTDNPARADDSRWIHRPTMPWDLAEARNDASTIEGRMFSGMRRLIRTKASLPGLHAAGGVSWFWTGHPTVLGFVRRHPMHGAVMVLANVSEHPAVIDPAIPAGHGFLAPDDRLAPGTLFDGQPAAIQLAGLQVRWIGDRALEGVAPRPLS
jgi:amylosucrase